MILNISLGAIFLGSAYALVSFVSRKIPELVAIPDEVITARLEEDSAKVRVFLMRFKSFYNEGRIKEFFWGIFAKILHRTHIVLMRLDNGTVSLLKRVRGNGSGNGNGSGAPTGVAVSEAVTEIAPEVVVADLPSQAPLVKSHKIYEVRTRKSDAGGDSQIV